MSVASSANVPAHCVNGRLLVTSGVERVNQRPFFASGKWRFRRLRSIAPAILAPRDGHHDSAAMS